jgi:predicted phosphodiesterase
MNGLLRIVSDLHLGHPGSRVERVESLAPLLDGVTTVVCNGDTWQELIEANRARGMAMLAEWRQMARDRGVELVLLPGNHDPGAGGRRHLDLAGGRVHVSHGDAIFPTGSPWSRMLPRRRREVGAAIAAAGDAGQTLAGRLALAGEIARILAPPRLPGGRSLPARVWDAVMPPGRAWSMLRSWAGFPTAAARFLEQFAPDARVFVCGHFHRAGAWVRRGRIILNTGSFMPPGAAWCVDLDDGWMTRRRVRRDRAGAFVPGPPAGPVRVS